MFNSSAFDTDDTYSFILLGSNTVHSTHNVINGNIIRDIGASNAQYGIRETSVNVNSNIVTSNVVTGAQTAQISLQGAASINANNIIT